MAPNHFISDLSAFLHRQLPAERTLRIEAHLRECPACREAFEEIRFGAKLASLVKSETAPESIWNGIQQAAVGGTRRKWTSRLALAGVGIAAAAMLVLIVVRRYATDMRGPSWEVTRAGGIQRLRPGESLETDSSSRAEIRIADVGYLNVEPNSRIRLLVTGAEEHRMALDRGRVEAVTWSPPRLFIVETPLATAIDLGCAYTLEVAGDGSSLLHVTSGLVALERDGRETIVPAGAFSKTRPGTGPGTPFFEDSSEQFQSALDYLDSGAAAGPERSQQLDIVIREARVRDGVSLWHLLPRLDEQARGPVYDRLAQLLPPPAGVTREGIMSLDPNMIASWREVVSQLWK